jgi:hypothetical protein
MLDDLRARCLFPLRKLLKSIAGGQVSMSIFRAAAMLKRS